MARFMLALKVVMAQTGAAETLIFDEVDTGIGGGTADAVGERLARLGGQKQVLVVTHAPQVAARASHHYIVEKSGDDDLRTNIRSLTKDERREEIARMLAGATITEEAKAAATKLLESAA
jgi:DNA repair protein RecN (Recombination protein N)